MHGPPQQPRSVPKSRITPRDLCARFILHRPKGRLFPRASVPTAVAIQLAHKSGTKTAHAFHHPSEHQISRNSKISHTARSSGTKPSKRLIHNQYSRQISVFLNQIEYSAGEIISDTSHDDINSLRHLLKMSILCVYGKRASKLILEARSYKK